MYESIRNIAQAILVGFLLIAISGITISIHHEHAIGGLTAKHVHGQDEGAGVNPVPPTYHEIHVLTFLSADGFVGSGNVEFKVSVAKLIAIPLDQINVAPTAHSAALTHLDLKETGPPSVDKCVLFCSFLI